MAESVKPRFAVDLDEIERQLADSHSAPQSPPASRNDPLAELARIVGQDDPFQSMLANSRAPSPKTRRPTAADDLFVSRDDRPRQPAADPRGSFSPDQPTDLDAAYAEQVRQYETFPAETPQDRYAESDYEHDRYSDPSSFEEEDEIPQRTLPLRTSRKTVVAIAAIVGAAVLGVGGALIAGRSTSMLSNGEPPLIKATNEPSKVQPQSPGGMEIPNQNKQIYERAGQEPQTKVVNREEQPVDIRQATRTASADATGATAGNSAAPNGLALGEPRKVRTISIRPDGTVILPDSKPAAAPAPAAMTLPPTTQARAPQAAMPLAPLPAETPHAGPAGTTTAPRLAAATPSTSGGSSTQAASTPAPQRVASAQPGVVAAAAQPAPQRVASVQPTGAAAAPQPAEAASGEGFSVQLGVSASETEAKATLQRFQQKFTDLKGKAPLIRKAEVNGSTLYRVRVGPMPRDEASSLCSKIQGQGGQCYVAKN